MDLTKLFKPFPLDAVRWRAQTITKDGTKALALAYLDARDVMDRLDEVCGVEGWQCRYSHANGKTVCDIGIKCGDEWVWKADGAGDTDVEAEKGALSDAFKRAAVRWGIGRYLYALGNTWVPCLSEQDGGKYKFKSFTDDCWKYVKGAKPAKQPTAKDVEKAKDVVRELKQGIFATQDEQELDLYRDENKRRINALSKQDKTFYDDVVNAIKTHRTMLQDIAANNLDAQFAQKVG